jgi:hypothetical protein
MRTRGGSRRRTASRSPKCWHICRIPGVTAIARGRIDFWQMEMPELEPDDAQMHLELYKNRDPEEDLGYFEDQRETNIELLRGLPADVGSRKARHRAAGEITLSQMLHEWALHDLGYVRQIAELVRAREYLAGAGPLGEDYQLKP